MKALLFLFGCGCLAPLIVALFIHYVGLLGILPGFMVSAAIGYRLWEYGEFEE
jgi:hypothetical protein